MVAAKRVSLRTLKENASAYLFLLPFLLVFILFLLVPFGWLLIVSFFSGSIFSPMQKFVGGLNYFKVIFEPFFQTAMKNTVIYAGIITGISTPLCIGLAVLGLSIKRNTFFTLALIFPFFVPIVVGGFMWRWMFHYDYGVINVILTSIGLPRLMWLSKDLVIPTVAGMEIWMSIGYYVLVAISGISAIPKELYEAADVDGAGGWRKFRSITLPLLRPMLTFIILMNLIWSFQIFDAVWIISGGGPSHASASLCFYIFTKAYEFYELEKAVVAGFFLMIAIFIMASFMMRLLKSEFEY